MQQAVWMMLAFLCCAVGAHAEGWHYFGGDQGGQHYSALDQISRDNVGDLQLAWQYQTGELEERPDRAMFASFNTTPLILPKEAGQSLVFCTPYNRIVALNPVTGSERWKFDPDIDIGRFPTRYNCRGIAYWNDDTAPGNQACKHRLFMGTTDLRVLAIDAVSGLRCQNFAQSGEVDAKPMFVKDYPALRHGNATFSSPPAVIGDTVIFGSSNTVRNGSLASPHGTVRAFDARSGAMKWTFDPVPYDAGDPQHQNWTAEALEVTSGANAWSMLSVDQERDLVFLPTGSASPDTYGGLRPGDNRYANSVVALRGSTGEVVWHFQTIHHDVWDWDLPAQPMLVTLTKDGDEIPAVVQLTKHALVFVLHRETGDPIFAVEERPVPTEGAVPGEVISATQPFPVKPEPLIQTGMTPEDAWGLTFWDKGRCRKQIEDANYGPLFTPPTATGTITLPGLSVTNWGGGAFDPTSNMLITTTNRVPFFTRLFPASQVDPADLKGPPALGKPKLVQGTPYALIHTPLLSPLFMPCVAPPWGELVAIDLESGDIQWRETLGTLDQLAPVPLPIKWGTPTAGGPIATAGGLIFIGATMDERFRAFDIGTGEELWKVRTPTAAMAIPMTYEVNGRQFVVIAAGGHMWQYSQKIGDWLVAYALPD